MKKKIDNKTFYLNEILFLLIFFFTIFQFYSPEFFYTIKESFLISLAIYAISKKNIYIYLLVVIIAPLIRESGIIISIFWFIFNGKNIRTFCIPLISILSLIIFKHSFDK